MSADALLAATIRAAEADPVGRLSPRERDVLALMAEGRSNQAISQQLFMTDRTVESHVRHIFLRLGLAPKPDDHRRVLAVLAYLRLTGAEGAGTRFSASTDAADPARDGR